MRVSACALRSSLSPPETAYRTTPLPRRFELASSSKSRHGSTIIKRRAVSWPLRTLLVTLHAMASPSSRRENVA